VTVAVKGKGGNNGDAEVVDGVDPTQPGSVSSGGDPLLVDCSPLFSPLFLAGKATEGEEAGDEGTPSPLEEAEEEDTAVVRAWIAKHLDSPAAAEQFQVAAHLGPPVTNWTFFPKSGFFFSKFILHFFCTFLDQILFPVKLGPTKIKQKITIHSPLIWPSPSNKYISLVSAFLLQKLNHLRAIQANPSLPNLPLGANPLPFT
jgi:hypothetical protein